MNNFTIVDPKEPLILDPKRVQLALRKALSDKRFPSVVPEVYLPSAQALELSLFSNFLETPWDSGLQGLRVSDFNGTGRRILERSGSTVLWSEKFDEPPEGLYPTVKNQFLDFLTGKTLRLMETFYYEEAPRFLFTLHTCIDLLRNSFVEEIKPRVLPRLVWPDRSTCVQLLKIEIGGLPFRRESFDGYTEIKREGSLFSFKVVGERGLSEHSIESEVEDEVYWKAFCVFTLHDYFEDDKNFVFNYVHLPRKF